MERRLAAILAADVVGYSRLVQADEAATLRRLKAIWGEVFETNVASHRGRIFKIMGDGALAEFASVVDAVECGVAIQQALQARKPEKKAGRRSISGSASTWATSSLTATMCLVTG